MIAVYITQAVADILQEPSSSKSAKYGMQTQKFRKTMMRHLFTIAMY
jgi:hypothetical protein